MKLFKKITSLFLAAAVATGISASAFAENTIIDSGNRQETSIIDIDTKPETEIIDEDDSQQPESGVDLTDTDYTPIDISTCEKWDGKSKMQSGTSYYISDSIKTGKNVTVPADSTLIICGGASLTFYVGGELRIRGSVIVEPDAKLATSGKLTVYKEAALDCYGELAVSKGAAVNLSSELVLRHSAKAVISGKVSIYKTGVYLNYGTTYLTKSSKTLVTGELQTPKSGKLMIAGYLGVTIGGRSTVEGYFSLSGELVNSGVFIFENEARFFKAKTARFAVSKSSRLIDYRSDIPSSAVGNLGSTTDVGSKGIDVSYAQGAVDWRKVKAAGIDFAFLRASRGALSDTRPCAVDATFEYNVTEAAKADIKIGVYHYLYASTVEEAREEAKFFLQTIKPYRITYPVVLDIEEQYQANLGKNQVTAMAKAFLEEIKNAGYYPMIYANKAWLTDYLDMSQLAEYDVWLAQWNSVPTYKGDFGVWQYSSKGIVSGIDGYVDLNISYKDYYRIIREGGYNNLK